MEFGEHRHPVFTGPVSLGPALFSQPAEDPSKGAGSKGNRSLEHGDIAVKPCRHGVMMYHRTDPWVGRSLHYYGEWNEAEVAFLSQFVTAGAIVLDIGAHIGEMTLPLSKLAGNLGGVYAFEPRRIWYQMLGANLAVNGAHRVRTFQNAVGKPNGSVRLAPLPFQGEPGDSDESFRTLAVDAMNLTRCDFIRIDAGGMENDILAGGRKTIIGARPVLYIKNNLEAASKGILHTLMGLDYRFWWHIHRCYQPENHEGRLENLFAGSGPEVGLLAFHRDRRMDFMGPVLPVAGPNDTRNKAAARSKGQRYYVHSQGNSAKVVPLYHQHTDTPPGDRATLEAEDVSRSEAVRPAAGPASSPPAETLSVEDLASVLISRRDPMALAAMHEQSGRRQEAISYYRRVLQGEPEHVEALMGLARSLLFEERFGETQKILDQVLDVAPYCHEALWYRSEILLRKGDHIAACNSARRAWELAPDEPRYCAQLATIFTKMGKPRDAMNYLEKAVALDPQNRAYRNALRDNIRNNISNIIPSWHFRMLNDGHRNRIYETAIERAVTRDKTVLEIGTGSGLLSMMAARAGAAQIHTCETISVLAEKARVIVARNGFSRQINVINKKSSEVKVGEDLPEKADLLVMEIFSSELLAEHVLPSIEDAKSRLLKPGAPILPGIAGIRGCLFGSDELEAEIRVEEVAGFDLRSFNDFTPPKYVDENPTADYRFLSDAFDVFDFDFFNQNEFPSEKRKLEVPVKQSGRCLGVMQWIWLDFGDGLQYENHPDLEQKRSHWHQVIYTFPQPIDLRAGQTVVLDAEHNRANVHIAFDKLEENLVRNQEKKMTRAA